MRKRRFTEEQVAMAPRHRKRSPRCRSRSTFGLHVPAKAVQDRLPALALELRGVLGPEQLLTACLPVQESPRLEL